MLKKLNSEPDCIREFDDSHVVHAIKQLLKAERLSRQIRFEREKPYSSTGATLTLNNANSILFEFDTPKRDQEEYSRYYGSSKYKLLFITCLRHKASGRRFDDATRLDLKNIAQRENIDDIVVWTHDKPKDERTLHVLKASRIHIVCISPEEANQQKRVAHFERIEGHDIAYSYAVSAMGGLLARRLKKLFHLVLSEIAAPIYDDLYAKTKIATAKFRNYEAGIIDAEVAMLKRSGPTKRAIDVGCGTGEYARRLAPSFELVDAFDFSPRMIEEAGKRKREADIENIQFHVADMEYDSIPGENDFRGKAGDGGIDLIVASFGMGSFVEDTLGMLRRFHDWLNERGRAVISFYNANSFAIQVTPNWRDASLAAQLDPDANTLRVRLTQRSRFDIYCKPYTEELYSQINSIFDIEKITTYPTVMALMPNSLLVNETANKLFHHIDNDLADSSFKMGHYVTVVVKKRVKPVTGHDRVVSALKAIDAQHEFLKHEPVKCVADVSAAIKQGTGAIVKTILFTVDGKGANERSDNLVAVVTLGDRRVDKIAIAQFVGVSANKLRFASQKVIGDLGFPLGGLAPFGFPEGFDGLCLIESDVLRTKKRWLYMGTGDVEKTVKIRVEDFKKVVAGYKVVGTD